MTCPGNDLYSYLTGYYQKIIYKNNFTEQAFDFDCAKNEKAPRKQLMWMNIRFVVNNIKNMFSDICMQMFKIILSEH